jgi:tRNA (guanosine-2'-O-)-methyltransferase
LVVAPLWVAYGANLGTLLRTCDAVGACMAVPDTDHYRDALKKGDTLEQRPCIHWVGGKLDWIDREQRGGARILGVELDEDSVPLTRLVAARDRSVVLLGHEHRGLPSEVWPFLDEVIEIPMLGTGRSLNVAVAGSLVLYKLAGLS